MRFMVNCQVNMGLATFWRVEDTEAMEKAEKDGTYNPIDFLQQPAMLINVRAAPERKDVQALVDALNGKVPV